ncbi:hypothetical protein D7V93_28750 [Corallococcus llansteffanensis]|uniref:Uncharacterized protein n=1 Tax=Corallococcus llansteffanensis TaxID=2316731 RepID=A0A3A8P5R6_9BACT|nr:hypothetical protein D7V93_28750 [Corallococcus llansteffanensis]
MVALASLLGACGPAVEGEELEGGKSTVAPAKESKAPGFSDPDAFEFAETGGVHAQALIGDLGTALGAPAATYSAISTTSNQWSVSCNFGGSRDISYIWQAPSTGSYTFSTIGSNFDTVLQIRNYRNASEILGCNDDYSTTAQSRIEFDSLAKGTALLIIIEAYDGSNSGGYGNYARLNIYKN